MNTLGRPSLLAFLSVLAFSVSAMAGSLAPSASPASTMRTLAEIYNAIAGTFDSSAITANQNGSLLETLKYLENQVPWASSSNNIWSLNSGNVGIGTSSLDAKLEVSGVASVSSLLIGGSVPRFVTSNSLDFDEFAASMTLDTDTTISNNGYALTLGNASISGNFELGSNGFFWNGTNVGIGTSRPDAKLEVNGTASISNSLYVISGGNVGIGTSTPTTKLHVGGAITLDGNEIHFEDDVNANSAGYINYYGYAQGATQYRDLHIADGRNNTVLFVDGSAANVGIGTTGPVDKLHVVGTKDSASIPAAGGVLISDSTSMAAGVGGALVFRGNYTGTTDTTAAAIHAAKTNGTNGEYGFDLAFNTRVNGGGNTEKMRITSAGNIGIGTSAPTTTLDVTGNASISGNFELGSNGFFWNGTNVGIGTSRPDAKLEVNGTASISNSLYVISGGNVGIGTSTPGASLELLKTQDGVNSELIKLQNNGSGANTGTSIGLYLGGTLAGQIAGNYVGGFQMQLQSGTTSLDIDSSGPVHVTNTGANNAQMYIGTSAALAVGNTAEVIFGPGTGFSATLGPRLYGYLESISEAGLRFDTYDSGRSTRMVITGAGNVGIGATTPEQKLTVAGNILASTSGNVDFTLRSSTTNGATNDDSQFTLRTGSASERFDIINGVGAKLFSIASAGNVGIGTTSPRAQVDVVGALPVLVASKSTGTDNASGTGTNDSLYVQGRYLYTVNLAAGNMEIYDVSNPAVPTLVSSTSSGAGSGSIHVQGNYAYIGIECGDVLVYDVSNPARPVRTGSVTPNACTEALQAQGRYLYTHGILGNGYTNIIDISNPSAPTLVSSYNNLNNDSRVTMFGKYLFGAENIFDVSNPASMSRIFNSTTGGFGDITPHGRYAYGVLGTTFRVYDISNIASPSTVGTLSGFTNGGRLPAIQGRYAYVVSPNSGGASTLYTVDISTPTAPRLVSTVSTLGVTASKPIVQGRYLYVKNRNSSSFHIYDLGGGYVQQIETGSIESSGLSVRGGARIGQDLELGGALSVGRTSLFNSGLAVTGNLSVVGSRGNFDAFNVASASGTSLFRISKSGFIGINDSTPTTTLDVTGNASISGNFELGSNGFFWNGTNVGIGTSRPDAKLEVNGTASISNSLYVISGGNVGIGTSAPTEKLHLSVDDATTNAVTDVLRLQHLTTGTAANSIGAGILFSSEDSTGTAEDIGRISGIFSNATHGAEAGALTFSTRNTAGIFERMRVASDGTVGIGTTVTGTAGLAVRTTAVDGLSVIASGNAGGSTGYGFYLEKSGTGGTNYGVYASISGGTTNLAALFKTTDSATTSVTEILRLMHDSNVAGGNGNGASMVLYGEDTIGTPEIAGTIAGFMQSATHGAEVGGLLLTPRGTGNVGIGTSYSPDAKLDVAGNITASTSGNVDIIIRSSTPTDDGGKFTLRSAGASDRFDILGSVPSGTGTEYTPRFSIASSGFAGVYIGHNSGFGSAPNAVFQIQNGGTGFGGGVSDRPSLVVNSVSAPQTSAEAVVKITSAFDNTAATLLKVGITSGGGGSPGGNLFSVFGDVHSDADSTDVNNVFNIKDGTGVAYFYGNVGMGTLSPAARLDVRSSISGNYDLLNVASSSGTSFLRVTKGGNVGIGTTTPTSKLQIVGGDCADDAGGGGCTADYAEFYPSTEDMQKGDLVMIDTATTSYAVKKATSAGVAIGIVSTNPAITIDGGSLSLFSNAYVLNHRKPAVALKGRVPLKVIGTIAPGDWLTVSDTPGYAQKATKPGMVVGVALEASRDGKVLTFVSPTWWSPTTQGESLVSIDAPTMSSIFSAMIQMFADVLHITFTDGLIKMRSVELETGATIKDKATGQPYCVQVEYGQLVTTSGPCGSGVTPTPTPEPTPDVTPTPAPEVTPEPIPESTPEITPEATPTPTPTSSPEVVPTPVPEPTPEVTPEPVL